MNDHRARARRLDTTTMIIVDHGLMKTQDASHPLLTRGESEVMRVLWKRGHATVNEVVEQYTRPIAYTTVLTVLRLLEQKGYVVHDKELPDTAERSRTVLPGSTGP